MAIERVAAQNGPGSTLHANWAPFSKPLEKVLAMNSGEGQHSYSKNSELQNLSVTKVAASELNEALKRVTLPPHGPIVVADLGCSSSANTIGHLSLIVNKLRSRLSDDDAASREFQAFFNDLSSNDFNNLFHLLSSDPRVSSESGSRSFFVAGVPGSFYDRLFCCSSVHVFHATSSVHWLSKIPYEVLDKNSPAYNRDKVWTYEATLATVEAYRKQSMLDLHNFLAARAAELTPGGLLFFYTADRQCEANEFTHREPFMQVWNASLEKSWNDLIVQGVVTQEEKNTFNVPIFFRSREETKEAIEKEGSFHLQSLDVRAAELNLAELHPGATERQHAEKLCKAVMALFANIFAAHIGNERTEIFMQQMMKIGTEIMLSMLKTHGGPSRFLGGYGLSVTLIRK